MKKYLIKFNKGATAIEYALIVGLIAAVLVTVLGLVGGGITNVFNQIVGALGTAAK